MPSTVIDDIRYEREREKLYIRCPVLRATR